MKRLFFLIQTCVILGWMTVNNAQPKKDIMKIVSSAFEHNGSIPSKYTCDGDNISPDLSWEGVPEKTKSFVLICDDPDAPMGTWDHWIVYNIPADVTVFPENIVERDVHANVGKNSWANRNYGGPCPPDGKHRYFFKLYALDIAKLDVVEPPIKKDVIEAMQGHILAEAELIGTYKRK